MGLSKSTRITILLAIDLVFFVVELVTGYAVHSLALVADSFHMLNDVLSLCVGLWAVKVAGSKEKSSQYTYGWQRAETLGALINGIFLVALCVTIFLEAIQRFVEPQEVLQPVVILVVGCCGLASNIIGLFLFHDHSHGHGGHSHGHSHGHGHGHAHKHKDDLSAAEEGHAHGQEGHVHTSTAAVADENGNIADVLPQTQVGAWPASRHIRIQDNERRRSGEDGRSGPKPQQPRRKSSTRSRSRTYSGMDDIPVHPASFRHEIIQASRMEEVDSEEETDEEDGENYVGRDSEERQAGENTPLLGRSRSNGSHKHDHKQFNGLNGDLHADHAHSQPKDAKKSAGGGGGHGHSHDLNMRGVFLHVMGDALGNIGVIGTALFIWKTDFSWRFYSDPAISLIITIIILCSAIPLCKAASRILLQGVPAGLNVDEIKADILALPDITSCHHLHVWQLSDTKLVASLHVRVAFEFEGEGSQRYMAIAKQIQNCLHAYGIHSSTIQPEFCCVAAHGHKMVSSSRDHTDDEGSHHNGNTNGPVRKANATDEHGCLLDCEEDCGDAGKCCDPEEVAASSATAAPTPGGGNGTPAPSTNGSNGVSSKKKK